MKYLKKFENLDNYDSLIKNIKDIEYILIDDGIEFVFLKNESYVVLNFMQMDTRYHKTEFNTIDKFIEKTDAGIEFIDRLEEICTQYGYKILNDHILNNCLFLSPIDKLQENYKGSFFELYNEIYKYGELLKKDGLDFSCRLQNHINRGHGDSSLEYHFHGGDCLQKLSYSQGLRKFESIVGPICDKLGYYLIIPRNCPGENIHPESYASKIGAKPNDELVTSSGFNIYTKDYWRKILNNKDGSNVMLINYGKNVEKLPEWLKYNKPYSKESENKARKKHGLGTKNKN